MMHIFNSNYQPSFWLRAVICACVYGGVAQLGYWLILPGVPVFAIWSLTGLAAALLLIAGRRIWPAIFLAALTVNLLNLPEQLTRPPIAYLFLGMDAAGTSIEALIIAWVLRHWRARSVVLSQIAELCYFVFICAAICAVGTLLSIASLSYGGFIPNYHLPVIMTSWWLGKLMSVLVFVPAVLVWFGPNHIPRKKEFWWTMCAFMALSWLVFANPFGLDWLAKLLVLVFLPGLAWLTFRYGLFGGMTSTAAMALIGWVSVVHGHSIFITEDWYAALLQLNSLFVLFAVTVLLLATNYGMLANRQAGKPWRKMLFPAAGLLSGCTLTLCIWCLVSFAQTQQTQRQFEQRVAQLESRLTERLGTYTYVVKSAAALFLERDRVTRSGWRDYVNSLNLRATMPGIQALGFVQVLSAGQLATHVQSVRAEGFLDYRVHPPEKRDVYTTIVYIEPFDQANQRVFGFDMYTDPIQRRAMNLARDTGQLTTSGKVTLRQENQQNEQAGFLMYMPVYNPHLTNALMAERQQALMGYVYAALRIEDLITYALSSSLGAELALEIYDSTAPNARNLLYSNIPINRFSKALDSKLHYLKVFDVGQHSWTLKIDALPGFRLYSDQIKPILVLLLGLLLSSGLFILLNLIAQAQRQALAEADRMAKAIRDAENQLGSLIKTTHEAIVIADGNDQIVSANPAAHELFGYAPGEMETLPVRTLIADEDYLQFQQTQIAHLLWPSQAVAKAEHVKLKAKTHVGQIIPVEISLSHWEAQQKAMQGMVFRDISEQQKAAEFVRGVFEEGPEAMLIVRADGRILQVNQRASQVFGYTMETLSTKSVEDLMPENYREHHVFQRQHFIKTSRRRAMGSDLNLFAQRADGEIFPVEIAINVLNHIDGAQYVLVIVDISQRKDVERRLNESLALTQAILKSANQAIIATQMDGTIISFNTSAERMLGYSASEMIGVNTPVLIHDPEEIKTRAEVLSLELGLPVAANFETFITKARLGLADENEWTYIRKDGSRFPVQLTVTPLYSGDHQLTGFLATATDISERKQQEAALRNALHEKETLLKEVYHRVKNNLQVVGSLFNMQLRTITDESTRQVLLDCATRVRSMALVHEKLYQSNTLSSLNLQEYLQDLCTQLVSASGADYRHIRLSLELSPVAIRLERAIPLGLLINELITNSLKHAFTDRGSGKITLRLEKTETLATIEVQDDGKGFSNPPNSSSKSLGIRLVHSLARQLDATIEMESRYGAYTRIQFPID